MALITSETLGGDCSTPAPPNPEEGITVKQYDVEINGIPTTLQLSDEEAKARGLKPAPEKKARSTVANKARTPAQKRADVASKSFGGAKK